MKPTNLIHTLNALISRSLYYGKAKINRLLRNQSWESQYTKVKSLGSGGNAQVVLVTDNNGNQFALKPLDKEYATRKEKRERFLREVDVMKNNLNDLSGVIPIVDYCDKGYWYVMPVADKSMDVIKKKHLFWISL